MPTRFQIAVALQLLPERAGDPGQQRPDLEQRVVGRDFAGELHLQRGSEVTDFTLGQVNVYVPQIEHISACVLTGETPAISG